MSGTNKNIVAHSHLDGRGVSRVSCHSAGAQQMTPTGHGHHSGPCGSVRVSCGCHQFHLVVSRDTDTWLLPRDGERRRGGWIGTSAADSSLDRPRYAWLVAVVCFVW